MKLFLPFSHIVDFRWRIHQQFAREQSDDAAQATYWGQVATANFLFQVSIYLLRTREPGFTLIALSIPRFPSMAHIGYAHSMHAYSSISLPYIAHICQYCVVFQYIILWVGVPVHVQLYMQQKWKKSNRPIPSPVHIPSCTVCIVLQTKSTTTLYWPTIAFMIHIGIM